MAASKKDKDDKLIKEADDQVHEAWDHERKNITKAVEDLDFVFSEDQWDSEVKAERGNRPCLNANDLPIFVDQALAAQRINRTGIKVLPVDNDTDPEKADIIGGLIRHIEHKSYARVAYEKAMEIAVAGGYCGNVRVITQYENEDMFDAKGEIKPMYAGNPQLAFNQVIRIVPVENSLGVLYDAAAREWHRNDGEYMFSHVDVPIDHFKKKYPDAVPVDFESERIDSELTDWTWYNESERTVRVAEWFRKEKIGTRTVYLVIIPGEKTALVDKVPDGATVLKERSVNDFKIVWRKISGKDVLEGPVDIPGRLWPIVPTWGKEININGERIVRGMFRYVHDVHQMDIYTQSAITELLALQPKSPYIGTVAMFANYEDKWRTANIANAPYLQFNPDPDMPGVKPSREPPPQIPIGLVEQSAQRKADKRDIIGYHQSSLGQRSNETSGKAIRERRSSDSTVSFAYHDNAEMAKEQVGRVIIGMAPTVYDTPRIIEILGEDGKTQTPQQINQTFEQNGEKKKIDLTIGKHDVVASTGPAYATDRMETLDLLKQLVQYAPGAGAVLVPFILEFMEVPNGEKIEKVLMAMLPPEVRAIMEGQDATITQAEATQMVQQAIEEFKESQEGQRELLKTEQQKEKTQQEILQTEQERLKLAQDKQALVDLVKEMRAGGQI